MMNDDTLHPMIRKVNLVHHQDESRHLAMGLRVVAELWNDLAAHHPPETLRRIGTYLGRYMQFFVQSFYNPSAYRDAGFDEPYEWRKRLMDAPERRSFHLQVLRKPIHFFRNHEIEIGEVF
jgi:hypothetical protein